MRAFADYVCMIDGLLDLMYRFLAPALPPAFVSGRRILFLGKPHYNSMPVYDTQLRSCC